MNRTYNFQVDNGIFLAEYYLDKDYRNIGEKDLRENTSLFSEKLQEYNQLSTLSSMSHHNSALTQGKKDEREERIKAQLELLLDGIGEDKACIICGEKRVDSKARLPYSSLMYGLASHDAFMNRANNLRTVDVCPLCLFFSLLSFLNTQKISYPFLYISDSDEFMRDITMRIQEEISENIMVDIKEKDMDKKIIPLILKLLDAKSDGVYEDLNYISFIQYANAKSNYFRDTDISRSEINFIMRIKDRGLIDEFYKLGLLGQIRRGVNLLRYISNSKKGASVELYDLVKEEAMNKDEISLVEDLAKKLRAEYGADDLLKELKLIKNQKGFRDLLLKYNGDIDLGLSLMQLDTMIQRYFEYVDYLRLAIQLEEKRGGVLDVK